VREGVRTHEDHFRARSAENEVSQIREQEGVLCAGQCLRDGLQKELATPKGGPKVKHGRLTLTVAAFGLAPRLSRVTDSVQAGQDSR